MRIELVCFTERGGGLGERLGRLLRESGDAARLERCGGGGRSLRQWADEAFRCADALVVIGAAGIAVRAVAPLIVSKLSDPAVVVVDEGGRFVVPLLSGHIGGANALAERIAGLIGAVPVVTTATDVNGVFAVDVWARENGMAIRNPERIKHVSATLLAGGRVALATAFPVVGRLPEGIGVVGEGRADIVVDIRETAVSDALGLVPPIAVLGVGCRKGVPLAVIERAFEEFCGRFALLPEAFAKVCSIDIKAEEEGVKAFCQNRSLPFETFSAERLMQVAGEFSGSDFVSSVTGADNVCERSAVLGSGGELLIGKTVVGGVALAAAVRKYAVRFYSEDMESA